MSVVVLSGDLMVISRIQGAAATQRVPGGRSVRSVATAADAIELIRDNSAEFAIIDLSMANLDLGALVHELTEGVGSPPRVIAFGPHVHEERLAAAREAGCDVVMSRGQFFAQVEAILAPR